MAMPDTRGCSTVRDGAKALAAHEITSLPPTGISKPKTFYSTRAPRGPKRLQFSIDVLPGEENRANNAVTRLVDVESNKRRILYMEGEPRWEYKFIRRAHENDRIVHMATMVRTSENKIYVQGDDPEDKEVADGFPTTADVLFDYQALIIGSVEANYFTPAQQELIKDFVELSRRRPAVTRRTLRAFGRGLGSLPACGPAAPHPA